MYDGIITKPDLDDIIIEHHGVKGMKWGVRRYQKYDGTYTQRGVKNVKEALSRYDVNKKKYDKARSDYKSGKLKDKSNLSSIKKEMQIAKKDANKAYKGLKMDKRADQGKALYKKGKTITNAYQKDAAIVTAASLAALVVKETPILSMVLRKNTSYRTQTIAALGILAAGAAAGATARLITANKNRKLRAFYAH